MREQVSGNPRAKHNICLIKTWNDTCLTLININKYMQPVNLSRFTKYSPKGPAENIGEGGGLFFLPKQVLQNRKFDSYSHTIATLNPEITPNRRLYEKLRKINLKQRSFSLMDEYLLSFKTQNRHRSIEKSKNNNSGAETLKRSPKKGYVVDLNMLKIIGPRKQESLTVRKIVNKKIIQQLQKQQSKQKHMSNSVKNITACLPHFLRSRSSFYYSKKSEEKIVSLLNNTIVASEKSYFGAQYRKNRSIEPIQLEIRQTHIGNTLSVKHKLKRNSQHGFNPKQFDSIPVNCNRSNQQLGPIAPKKRKQKSRGDIRGWDFMEEDSQI